jgi:magnesium-transporting ATPase (P-type)
MKANMASAAVVELAPTLVLRGLRNSARTEGALYPFAAKIGLDRQKEQAAYPRIDVIPFESEHRFMATLHTALDGGQVLLVKGAPEVIMDHCDRQEDKTGQHPPIERENFLKASDTLAAQGERVLALAWLPNPRLKTGGLGPADLPKNLVLLGLIGLLDPPRKEAVEAVKECHAGGIRVTMITGDHKITAAAIAKMLDIGDGKTAIAGAEIAEMDTATLQERVRDVDVFARASPEHKLRLVKAIQANKQIVAMRRRREPHQHSRKPTSASPWGSRTARSPRRRPRWYWPTTTSPRSRRR